MKKIRTIILTTFCAALTLTSCDMDKYPYDKIPVESVPANLSDCQSLRSGMYRDLRIIASNQDTFMASEMLADCLVPTNNYGNQWSSQYLWEIAASDGSATTAWNNAYVAIAQCNLLINGIERLQTEGKLTDSEAAEAENILGEAYLIRAMMYYDLATRFCSLYDAATAESTLGLPLVDTYAPSADNSTFPGRSSLAATYQFILDDISSAKENLTAEGAQESEYLTTDALTAFEARVAFMMGNYDTAITASTSLINSQKYPLINDQAKFSNMWLNDTGTELICQLYSSQQELSGAMGAWFLDEVTNNVTILPADDILTQYSETDIRFNAYFAKATVNFANGTIAEPYVVKKYPGNPAMYTGTNNYVNKLKLFRISEMYLIAAEAYYKKGDATSAGKSYEVLYQLMSARDASVQNTPVTGNKLWKLIQDERLKELCYEGTRWLDLKRYGEGFTRMSSQSDDLSYNFGLNQEVAADDHQWVWPIPQDEIEANPQIKGQQNPGY